MWELFVFNFVWEKKQPRHKKSFVFFIHFYLEMILTYHVIPILYSIMKPLDLIIFKYTEKQPHFEKKSIKFFSEEK